MRARRHAMADLVATLIVLCRGHYADGVAFWAYIALRPSDAGAFYEARKRGLLNLEHFGTILTYGEGEEPPEDVRIQMQEQYGMRDDFEKALLEAVALHS